MAAFPLVSTLSLVLVCCCCFFATSSAQQSVTVQFEVTSYNVSESAVMLDLQVNVTSTDGAPDVVTVTITGFPGADPMDFNISNDGVQPLTFILTNDNVLGPDLSFDVVLTSADANVNVIEPNMATVNITDDDMVTIGFEQTTYTVFEGDNVMLCVNLSTGLLGADREVMVILAADEMSGSGGMSLTPDYDPLPVTLTLSSLSTRQCVEVSTRFNVSLNPFNVRLTTVESPSTVSLTPGSATVTILEVIAPTITTQPVSIEGALPNSNVSFSVMADGQPLNYQWSMVTERGNTITLEATEATLRLDAVTVENDGVYFCDVSNRRGSVRSDNVSLTILRTPTVTLTVPTGVVVGTQLNITCEVNVPGVDNANIELTVIDSDGNMVPFSDVETMATRRVVSVTAAAIGAYNVTCVANNSGLTDSLTEQFDAVTIEVDDVIAGVSATAVFYCNVTGATGGVTYSWTVMKNAVPQTNFFRVFENRIRGNNTNRLEIVNLSGMEQDFDYRCTVFIDGDLVGSATGGLTSPGPLIAVGPMNQTLQAGEDLTLTCTGVNNDDATMPLAIFWMFAAANGMNSQTLLNSSDPRVTEMRLDDNVTVVSYFTVINVTANYTGNYTCVLSNRALGTPRAAMEMVTVTVFFTPLLTFTLTPTSPVPVGTNILLRCEIRAQPIANFAQLVRIRKSGSRTVLRNRTNDANETAFTLSDNRNVKFPADDGARFRCQATNDNGLAQEDIGITVQDRPQAINHSQVSSQLVSLTSVNITWNLPSDNNAPITEYLLLVCERLPNTTTQCPNDNITIEIAQLFFNREANLVTYTYIEALPRKTYEVFIRAVNSIGPGDVPERGGGHVFNSAFPDDGKVVNVNFIPSTNLVIVSWMLPPLARATTELENVTFNVTYFSDSFVERSMTEIVDYNEGVLEQGITFRIMDADSSAHTVEITARYLRPDLVATLVSLTGIRTLPNGGALMPNARVTDTVPDGRDELTVSWPPANSTDFLRVYRVSFSFTVAPSSRKRRQAMRPMDVQPDRTSTTLQFQAFSDYNVNVDAVFAPPPDRTDIVVPLLPPTTFTTPQRPASIPTNVVGRNDSILKIRLDWGEPVSRNGIITGYRVRIDTSETRVTGRTFLSQDLIPNRQYVFQVLAINGGGDGLAATVTLRSGFSVVPPVIINTGLGNAEVPRFTISTDPFSDRYGGLGVYKVVVVRGSGLNTSTVIEANLRGQGTDNPFNYYVAVAGDFQTQPRSTFIIGDGTQTTLGGDTFINPAPEVGVDYFIFIRLYSSIDSNVFADSSLTGALQIATPLNPAVIIAPIAVIAIILLAILIVLLVIVYLFARPGRGYTIASTRDDGAHRKKRGGGIELRRTRLFSPVVNVPVPDVFTSAGQPTTLVCEASGTPAPEVVWTQNNEPLDKERFIHLADSSLFINDTDLKDEGAYIVTATNSAGTAEQMVRVTVIRPTPPESDPDHPPIQVGEFTEKIALLRSNDDEGLEDEYSEVEPEITFTSYAAKININKNKNRYINIIPYDHSRVVLSLQDNTPGSDYINGSYIDGFNRPNAYIATQGPQPSTFPDFWRMVWELDTPTIVMVTNLKEEDKLKCHQYWPNYGTTTYGNIQVTLKGVENLAEYSIRTFNITPIAGQSRVQMPVREVKQFHFLVWPDHGVPQFATPLLSFRKRVAKYHPNKKGPMVVHCSAGVGRTGTFITIDTMLRKMESEGVIDVFNFVRHMRFRRNYMVQTAPQYVFIHDALLEAIMCGDNSIPAPELRKRLQYLMETEPESGKSRLQLQFENLNSNSPQDDDFDCTIASLPDNMAKNRFKVHLPANDVRVPLGAPPSRSDASGDNEDEDDEKEKAKEEPDYICASFADGYRQRHAFIITQAPMSDTTGDFWKMVWEQKSAAIVMLTELEEDGKELCVKYWPGEVGEASLFGSFQLELSEDEKDKGDYVTRKFKLSHVDAPQECRIVTQFHFTKWPRSSTPSNSRSMIDLIDEIQRVQRKSGNQPITIHCDDGVSRTGAFCSLYYVLERVKVEQVVDVYLATKTLRIQRSGLLETLEQYVFVHKAVIEYLDTFSDYQNFK